MKKLAIIFLLLWGGAVQASSAVDLRCVVLAMGEGQAVLLQQGAKGMMIDTGHFGMSSELQAALRRYGVEEIETVFLTHLHPDHASGIFALMAAYPRATVYESGHRIPFSSNIDSARWVAEQLDAGRWQVRQVGQGDTITWREVVIEVLWPSTPTGDNLNSQSLVLAIAMAGKTLLVMGDAGREQERHLLASQHLPENVDVLVVGHHGAADATSAELLKRVSPAHGVISSNAGNRRGYPSGEVLQRLREHGVAVHLTTEKGDFVWRTATLPNDE